LGALIAPLLLIQRLRRSYAEPPRSDADEEISDPRPRVSDGREWR
jgi:hypothetical protein